MNESDVQQEIKKKFINHKYSLLNTWVFGEGWESDYFSITDFGYSYEVEVKISRSDFFVDFKKPKHKLFEKIFTGATHYYKNQGKGWKGELICLSKVDKYVRTNRISGRRNWSDDSEVLEHWDMLNNYKDWRLDSYIEEVHAPCTAIIYVDLTKQLCPNRFYYAVPDGLIKKEEVPDYAGLIYVSDGKAVTIKEAPFLHKRICDLTHTLLEKFYYQAIKLKNRERDLKYRIKSLEKQIV